MKTEKKATKKKAGKVKTWVEKKIELNRGLLSRREVQVFLMIVQGYRNDEIMKKLGIVYDTLKSHRTSIYKKLDLENAVQLTHVAIKQGLISQPVEGKQILCVALEDKPRLRLIELADKKKVKISKFAEELILKGLKG